jgi:hypothetical protein
MIHQAVEWRTQSEPNSHLGKGLMMIGEISAALSSVNTAIQIAKTAIGVQQDVSIKLEINKMLDAVLEAKAGLLEASDKIASLQEELRQAKAQLSAQTDLKNYDYVQLTTGARVIALKGEDAGLHYCPTCFEAKELRVLQTERDDSFLRCYSCKGVFKRDFRQDAALARARDDAQFY